MKLDTIDRIMIHRDAMLKALRQYYEDGATPAEMEHALEYLAAMYGLERTVAMTEKFLAFVAQSMIPEYS